jgi:hypothetical protein
MSGDEMSLEKALEILGVTDTTPAEDVTKAYRELTKHHHPDLSGNGAMQLDLNRAYDVVLAHHRSRALVPAAMKEVIVLMERNAALVERNATAQRRFAEAQNAKRRADELATRVTRRLVRPIQVVKYAAFIFAAVPVAVSGGLPSHEGAQGVMLLLGLIGAGFQFLVDHQKHLMDAFTERLSDDMLCVEMLRVLGPSQREFVASDLIDDRPPYVYLTPNPSLFRIDRGDGVRLTLLKSLEHGILERPAGSKRKYRISDEYLNQFPDLGRTDKP